MAFKIFLHSINLVFGQFGNALRVSGALYVLNVLLFLGATSTAPLATNSLAAPTLSWNLVLASLISGFLYIWIAVAWHRHVLIDEPPPKMLPGLRVERMLPYFGRSLQTGLIAGLVMAIAIAASMFVAVATHNPWIIMLLGFLGIVVGVVITYRLAPLLPAAALGRPTTLAEAWASTSGAVGTFVGIAVLSSVGAVVIDLPMVMLQHLPMAPVLIIGWSLATGWVKLMVGVSILTTIYGVFEEKRLLPSAV